MDILKCQIGADILKLLCARNFKQFYFQLTESVCSRSESLETSPVPPSTVEPLYSKVEPSSSRHRRHQSVCGVPIGGAAQPQVPNHIPPMDTKDILTEDLAVREHCKIKLRFLWVIICMC